MTGVARKAKAVVADPGLLAMSLSNALAASALVGRTEPVLPTFKNAPLAAVSFEASKA